MPEPPDEDPGLLDMAGQALARPAFGPWIEARYNGTCRACGARWEPGDQIRWCEDEGSWACSCTEGQE